MPKRPDTHKTILLALELMRRIPRSPRKITAEELHKQMENLEIKRGLRTIQRQLEMLSSHFDIERDDRSRPYGYCWKKESKGMALMTLTTQESLLLGLAEEHLRSLLPPSLMGSMGDFFTQARSNLHSHANAKLEREWLKKVRVVPTNQPLLPPTIKSEILETVGNALYANQWLEVKYENAAGKCTSSEVMPLGLVQQGARMYLVCRFKDYNNERNLALNRIIKAKISPVTFKRPEEFNLEKYNNDGRFGYGEGKTIKLSFHIDKSAGLHLLESWLSEDQQVVELDDVYEIVATVVDTEMLNWWLRGFGDLVSNIQKQPIESIAK